MTIPEAARVRRAWLTLAAQPTAALAVVLVIAGAVAWLLLLHNERVSEDELLEQAVRPAARDDVTDPSPGIALFVIDRTRRVVGITPGTRSGVFDPHGLRASPSAPVRAGHTVTWRSRAMPPRPACGSPPGWHRSGSRARRARSGGSC